MKHFPACLFSVSASIRVSITAALLASLLFVSPLAAQSAPPASDPFKALAFLEGNWEATTQNSGQVHVVGTYAFQPELGGHILARHTTSKTSCKGPDTFDCEHGDLLYIFEEAPGQPLKAIYFDNEGHVIHYNVSTPTASSVIFLSDASVPGPQFRLTYELKNSVLSGKFQMQMPGQSDWKSYLEWSGGKQ
jgi:hypothetical protein